MEISARFPAPRDIDDLKSIQEVLLSNTELTGNSPHITSFEEKIAKYFGVQYCIAVSSGTAAIHCALQSLKIKDGDEVIVPVTAAIMSAMPIILSGAKPIFVDIEPNSFQINLEDLKKKINTSTRCILSVPMWGYPCFYQNLKQFGIPVLEDAAQAIGTLNGNKLEGTLSDIGCFSTHELKLLSTGEGGFIITNEATISEKVRSFSRIGLQKFSSDRSLFGHHLGLNYKMNAITAALGNSQLNKLSKRLRIRKENANLWKKYLFNHTDFKEVNYQNGNPSYYGLALTSKSLKKSNYFASLLAQNGIETDVYRYDYKPLSAYPIFKSYTNQHNFECEFNHAYNLFKNLIVLPTHEGVNESKIIQAIPRIISALDSCL